MQECDSHNCAERQETYEVNALKILRTRSPFFVCLHNATHSETSRKKGVCLTFVSVQTSGFGVPPRRQAQDMEYTLLGVTMAVLVFFVFFFQLFPSRGAENIPHRASCHFVIGLPCIAAAFQPNTSALFKKEKEEKLKFERINTHLGSPWKLRAEECLQKLAVGRFRSKFHTKFLTVFTPHYV